MTTFLLPADTRITVEVTEPSSGHVTPFLVAMAMFLASSLLTIWLTGMPH